MGIISVVVRTHDGVGTWGRRAPSTSRVITDRTPRTMVAASRGPCCRGVTSDPRELDEYTARSEKPTGSPLTEDVSATSD